MVELTVIIPFLNEGSEIETTIKGIKRTAYSNVKILIVDDASTDGFNYKEVADRYGVEYVKNATRLGSAASREIGIRHCTTPYFLTIDGHMRFYEDFWWKKIVAALKNDERALYCCRCKPWCYETGIEEDEPAFYGAFICLNKYCGKYILDTRWIVCDLEPYKNVVNVPCILGACYAASKKYWQFLRGEEGLRYYGCDEQGVSIKAWMEGGRCCLIKDVTIGLLFRYRMTYPHKAEHMYYNKAFIAETLFPEDVKNLVYKQLSINSEHIFTDHDREMIQDIKCYYKRMNILDFERFLQNNERTIELIYAQGNGL